MRPTQATRLRIAIFAALTLIGAPVQAAKKLPTAPVAPASPKQLYSQTRVHTVHVQVSREGWALMQPNATVSRRKGRANADKAPPRPAGDKPTYVEGDPLDPNPAGLTFAYARGRVEVDGQPVADVGVRFKGNISYIASATSPRRPMKLDFDRFVDDGRFAGVTSLNLNNMAFDPSMAREALAFELFREMNVPAPRTGRAVVYLSVPGLYDRECLGLYTLIEEVDDKRFLKRHFGEADGPLLKPERMRGLAYLGEDWSNYASRYNPKGDVPPAWGRRVIELARLINRGDDVAFRERIGLYLDVDEVLRYVAVNSVIVNLDSFLSTGHNYYLYFDPADGRGRFVPWDMNLSFGGYSWVANAEQSARTAVRRAYVDHNKLVERLLAIDEYDRAYRRHVRRLTDELLTPERVRERRAAMTPVLDAAADAARAAGKADSPTTRPATGMRLVAPELWAFVDARVRSVRAQLDGADAGFRPGFRDPQLLPPDLGRSAPAGVALMAAVDRDGDELLTEAEVGTAIDRLAALARVSPGSPIERPAAAAAIDRALSADLRARASGEAWAAWLFNRADANQDGKLERAELLAAYRRHLDGVDRDLDAMMGGREIVEALSSAGAPH